MRKSSVARLWSYLERGKRLFGLASFLGIVWAAANTLGIALAVRSIMNAASVHSLPMLVTGVKCLAVTAAIMAVFGAAGNYLVSLVTERSARSIRRRVFEVTLHGSPAYLDCHESGDTISRLVSDVETAKQGYPTLHNGLSQVWQLLWALGTLFALSWQVAVAAIGLAGLCFGASAGFAKPLKSLSLAYQTGLSRVTESATNLLSGIATVKGLRAEEAAARRFDAVTGHHLSAGRKRAATMGLQSGVMNAMPFVAMSAMIYVAGRQVFGQSMSAGDAVALAQLSTRVFFPLTILGNVWATLQLSLAAVDRVSEALQIPQERAPRDVATAGLVTVGCPGDAPSIEFRDVSFSYDGDRQVLERVSFRLPGGTRMALAGPSGSGKTTVLKLLLGMYVPGSGSIRIGGVDIRDMSLEELRRSVAVVPQEPWLFPGTVRENILLGKAGANHEELARAADLAHAHEFIMALPHGYDTVLDERGSNLSGGQRQRLCLARAFLKNAPVLLLDEPTSSVDAESERLIGEAVERLSKGRTVVTIAHTAQMMDAADVRVALDGGRAVPN